MNFSRGKRWTSSEKWLFAAPLLVGVFAAAMSFGPDLARRKLGLPRELATSASERMLSLSLSQDGRVLAAGTLQNRPYKSAVNTIHLWDARSLKSLSPITRPLTPNNDATYGVFLSPDGKQLTWNSFGVGISSFDLTNRRLVWTTRVTSLACAVSPDSRFVVFQRAGFQVVDGRNGTLVTSWKIGPRSGDVQVRFSPDSKWLASSAGKPKWGDWQKTPNARGGEIEVRRVGDWKQMRTLSLPNASHFAFSPDGTRLLGVAHVYQTPLGTGSLGTRLRCFDAQTGRVLWEVDKTQEAAFSWSRKVQDVCFSADGKSIGVTPYDEAPSILNALDGKVVRTLRLPPSQQPNSSVSGGLAFSPDGKRLFARGKNAVLVWDLD